MAKKTNDRWTNEELAALDEQIVEALTDDRPQSVRHVFYLMTNPRLPVHVSKDQLGYDRVQRRVSILRETGTVPYTWIADATRNAFSRDKGGTSALAHLRWAANSFRYNFWADIDFQLQVWAESRSLASVIEDVCGVRRVDLYPAGGFTSRTFAHRSAQSLRREKKPATIFYVGDYDPAGMLIDEAVEREIRKHLPAGFSLDFVRLGVTWDQVVEMDLPTKPRKPGEKRRPDIEETVEAEAMPAHAMRELVENAIDEMMPSRDFSRAKEREQQELISAALEQVNWDALERKRKPAETKNDSRFDRGMHERCSIAEKPCHWCFKFYPWKKKYRRRGYDGRIMCAAGSPFEAGYASSAFWVDDNGRGSWVCDCAWCVVVREEKHKAAGMVTADGRARGAHHDAAEFCEICSFSGPEWRSWETEDNRLRPEDTGWADGR